MCSTETTVITSCHSFRTASYCMGGGFRSGTEDESRKGWGCVWAGWWQIWNLKPLLGLRRRGTGRIVRPLNKLAHLTSRNKISTADFYQEPVILASSRNIMKASQKIFASAISLASSLQPLASKQNHGKRRFIRAMFVVIFRHRNIYFRALVVHILFRLLSQSIAIVACMDNHEK